MGAQLSFTKDLRAFQDHWLTGSMKLIGNMTEATSHYLIQVGKVLTAVFRRKTCVLLQISSCTSGCTRLPRRTALSRCGLR